ncbi:methyl-accepting chemotaxis protein [Aquibacillus albus]|uniref:Methyl-accepting chemotaxis protein n=1 Tax=Aquibacillus albus TaxID=1168171 RepID=A0ABS2N050_9BACI|nr:methyl-accepting chemotaxis protein [Aquibacillus albus]MBM7571275.1 methyl-accepting chemotaxis protein [Aquibacillus albus]
MERKTRFNLRWKLVVFTTLLATITYSTSALFIYFVYDQMQPYWNISEIAFVILTLGLGIIWSGILTFFTARFVTKPLIKLETIAAEVAAGNLEQEVELPKSRDEIYSLSLAFQKMLFNLREIMEKIEDNFDRTNQSVQEIKAASSKAASQTNLIEQTVYQISSGAEDSSNAIQQTAESIEVATRLAGQVQDKAMISREKSSAMVHQLSTSKEVIHHLISGIQSLAKEQESSLQDVDRLEKNAVEVNHIISMVGELAEQTNLLALNASIEAARAGDHGRGFAVVAEEVRKLADQSTKAVQGISEHVSNIQSDVRQVVAKMTEQVDFARSEATKGEDVNHAILQMSTSIEGVAAAIEDISSLVDKQLREIKETSKQSQEVSAIAEETSASAQQMSASIQQQTAVTENLDDLATVLEEHAQILKKQIRRFQLKH